jgi:hypothetical protein
MAILIRKFGDLYEAEVTPPHGGEQAWKTVVPLSVDELIAALKERGCRQTDIGDAFYAVDPDWLD